MERLITQELLHTLQTSDQKIVLYGPSCIGKSYLLQELAKKYHGSYISCDLITDRAFCTALNECIIAFANSEYEESDSFHLLHFLNQYFHMDDATLEQTLIIFDGLEILNEAVIPLLQMNLPNKFLAATSRGDYLRQIPMPLIEPPLIRMVSVAPMNFREFLEATGHHWYRTIIQGHVITGETIPELIHNDLQELFYDYLLVGGFPQAILQYISNRTDISAIRSIHNQIYSCIRYQIAQAPPAVLKTFRIEQIFHYLSENTYEYSKPFRPGHIQKGTSTNDYIEEIHYLIALGLLIPVYNQKGELYRFEIIDCGMQRFLSNDYDIFYAPEEEEREHMIALCQTYLYSVLYTMGERITSWQMSRTFYASYYNQRADFVILSGEPKARSHVYSTLRTLGSLTIWQLQQGEPASKHADHNIQCYALEEALFSKNNFLK